ncbi:MAG: NAD-dependent epimerase/dehydratase family protein [Actinomycetota bacterium]
MGADETWPLRPDSPAHYSATKAMAEQRVRRAAGNGFETVVVRPRLVWGPGDTTLLPPIAKAMDSGRFAWIGGGRHLTSTTHVDNVIEGLMLGAERGRSGEAYFVTDGDPPVTRLAVWLSSQECTLDISKARRELDYEPVISRDQGLAALSE